MTVKKQNPKGIAVVTGASAGFGKVYADRLAQRGYDLLLVARRTDRLQRLAEEIRSRYGVSAETMTADLASATDLARVAARIESDEHITMLINNAGSAAFAPSEKIPYATVENLLRLNSESLTRLSLAALPGFRRRNSGTIVNIGSILSLHALPISTAYSGTKAHVMLFTIGLQRELAGTGVRVQLVIPSSSATEFWDVGGVGTGILDPATVMTAEDCVDAALAGLDQGEAVTLPSLEDAGVWKAFDDARIKVLAAAQTGRPASRYNRQPVGLADTRISTDAVVQ